MHPGEAYFSLVPIVHTHKAFQYGPLYLMKYPLKGKNTVKLDQKPAKVGGSHSKQSL